MTLLIDADDTLWENIRIFNDVNTAYLDWLLPGTPIVEMQADLDALQIEFISRHGYGRHTFERSLVAGVERFVGRTPSNEDAARVAELVRPLDWDTIEVLDDVESTLAELTERRRLILVTKGDHDEQQLKIERSGLGPLFAAIEILDVKTVVEYHAIIDSYDLDPTNTWMVGNSPKSDIVPALEAGLGAVHIPHEDTWGHEIGELPEHPRLTHLPNFASLVQHF